MTIFSNFRLESIVEIDNLSPLQRNILVSFAMVVYYKSAIEFACFLRRNWVHLALSRNFLHMSFSFLVLFWPLFDTSDGWSWKLSALLPAVVFARLVYKGIFVRDASDADVQNMALSGSPSDLLLGPLMLAGVFVWLTLAQFMTPRGGHCGGGEFWGRMCTSGREFVWETLLQHTRLKDQDRGRERRGGISGDRYGLFFQSICHGFALVAAANHSGVWGDCGRGGGDGTLQFGQSGNASCFVVWDGKGSGIIAAVKNKSVEVSQRIKS